jgi:hypothetical protein
VTGLLSNACWDVNHKRVERIWRREGIESVPQKKKGRLWLNDGSCMRLRPERLYHVGPMTSNRIAPQMAHLPHTEHHRRIDQGSADDPRRSLAQLNGHAGRADRSVHSALYAGIHQVRQWAGIYCLEGAGLDHSRRPQESLHRARIPWENGD